MFPIHYVSFDIVHAKGSAPFAAYDDEDIKDKVRFF